MSGKLSAVGTKLTFSWMTAKNSQERVVRLVLDIYLWQLLSCVVATVCVGAVSLHGLLP